MKKILFIEANHDGTTGGSHLCLLQLVKCLDRNRYTPVVMFYSENVLIGDFAATGCKVEILKPFRAKRIGEWPLLPRSVATLFQKSINFLFLVIFTGWRSLWYVFKNAPDAIHLNNCTKAGWEWLFAAKVFRKKCVVSERGYPTYTWLSKFRARYFDGIFCVSKVVKENLQHAGICNRCTVIYDGIDTALIRSRVTKTPEEVKKEFVATSAAPLIGVVGNIQEWKGQDTVVRAVHLLRSKYSELVCLLVGAVSPVDKKDQAYHELLINEIDRLDLAGKVILTGYRGDVPDLMNAMDIVLHSSRLPEPFGMVVLEGMSLEKPVIATSNGGPREIIEDGVSGFLVPPDEPRILADRVDALLQNHSLRQRVGENALRRVEEKFNLALFSQAIANVYNELFS